MPIRRDKKWEIKTRPELWHPVLAAKHELSAQLVSVAYRDIDQVYERVARILDEHGVIVSQRLLYRSYCEELWQVKQNFSAKTAEAVADAVLVKYWVLGGDEAVLSDIAEFFGFDPFDVVFEKILPRVIDVVKEKFKEALEEAYTLLSPKVAQNPLEVSITYDPEGRISVVEATDRITGAYKRKTFEYDPEGRLIRIVEERVGF